MFHWWGNIRASYVILFILTCVVALVISSEASVADNQTSWSVLKGNAQHTGTSENNISVENLRKAWVGEALGDVSIIFGGGNNFIASIVSPVIGPDGTIYLAGGPGDLSATSPDGKLKWRIHVNGEITGTPAVSPNGTVFFGTYAWMNGTTNAFYAVSPDGSVQWEIATDAIHLSSPVIGPDGTIYVGTWNYTAPYQPMTGNNSLLAISPNGSVKWQANVSDPVLRSPAIAPSGNIYVLANLTVYCFSPSGDALWNMTFDRRTEYPMTSELLVDPNGSVYFVSEANETGYSHKNRLVGIYSNGTLKWDIDLSVVGGTRFPWPSPLAYYNGTIYYEGDTMIGAVHDDGSLTLVGEIGWHSNEHGFVMSNNGLMVSCCSNNELRIMDTEGNIVKALALIERGEIRNPVIGPDGTIYVVADMSDGHTTSFLIAVKSTEPLPFYSLPLAALGGIVLVAMVILYLLRKKQQK